MLTGRAARAAALGKCCEVWGCLNPYLAARGLCWSHYRVQLKRLPADPQKGLGCYRGLPRKIIQLRAAQKRDEKQRRKQRQGEARRVLFDEGNGMMRNLSRAKRAFVNLAIHESYDLHCFRRSIQGQQAMRFRAFRLRWYGVQKLNWLRFDMPRRVRATLGWPATETRQHRRLFR